MICTKCQHRRTSVTCSVRSDYCIRRYRKCPACKHRFTTVEWEESQIKMLQDDIERLQVIVTKEERDMILDKRFTDRRKYVIDYGYPERRSKDRRSLGISC